MATKQLPRVTTFILTAILVVVFTHAIIKKSNRSLENFVVNKPDAIGAVSGLSAKHLFTPSVEASILEYGGNGNGIADNTKFIRTALNTGKCVYFPPGIYISSISFRDGDCLIGESPDRTTLKYANNGVGAGFSDLFSTVTVHISNLTLARTGTGYMLDGEGQKARYDLNITTASSFHLNNVKLSVSGFTATDRANDMAGVIALVNEGGTIHCNACEIDSVGRAIYHPSNKHKLQALTIWIGNIISLHKAVSLHQGTIIGYGNVTCNNQRMACLSTASGRLIWSGIMNVISPGGGQMIYNAIDADDYFYGVATSTSAGVSAVLNQGRGKVTIYGEIFPTSYANLGTGSVDLRNLHKH